jgi:hypothetical protein
MHEQFSLDSSQAQQIASDIPPPEGLLTPEQIASRNQLVQLHREVEDTREYKPTPFIDQLSALSPDEARELIQRERSYSEEIGRVSSNLQEYNEYVADLRKVRAEQRDHITSELQKIPDDAPAEEKKAAFLDALDHSPVLANKVLQKVNELSTKRSFESSNDAPSSKKLFSEEDILNIAANGESFQQALTQIIIREPAMVFRTISILEKVTSKDEIRNAISTAAETHPSYVLGHMDTTLKYFAPEEGRKLLVDIAQRIPSEAIGKLLLYPQLAEVVGESDVAKIAQKAVTEGSYLPGITSLQECVDKGYITTEAIRDRVIGNLKQVSTGEIISFDSNLQDVSIINSELFGPEDRQLILNSLVEVYETGPLGLLSNIHNAPLLSDEMKGQIFQTRLSENPQEVVRALLVDGTITKFVDADTARSMVLDFVENFNSETILPNYQILRADFLTPDDKRNFVLRMINVSPYTFLMSINLVDGSRGEALYSKDELSAMVISAAELSPAGAVSHFNEIMPYLGDIHNQKSVLIKALEKSPDPGLFLRHGAELTAELLTEEERLSLFRQSVDALIAIQQQGEMPLSHIDLGEVAEQFGVQEARSVADKLISQMPSSFLSDIREIAYLYPDEELGQIILGMAATSDGQQALLSKLSDIYSPTESWANEVDASVVREVLLSARVEQYEILLKVKNLENYFSPDELSQYATKILNTIPTMALEDSSFFEKYIPGFDASQVVENALQNEVHMGVLGKYLTDTLRRIEKTENQSARERLIIDAGIAYVTLEKQIQAGTLEGARTLREKFDLNAKSERALFETYDIITTLGNTDDIDKLSSIESIEVVDLIAVQAIAGSLGIEGEVTAEQSTAMLSQLGRAAPLGLYVAQYRQSGEHVAVLKPLTEALLAGDYESWKFGEPTVENLESLKQLGLIPANMTEQQYILWQQESASERTESFTVQTNAVMSEVERILSVNEIELPERSIIEPSERVETLEGIAREVSDVGQNIGKLHQELKTLRTQPDQEMAKEQITELEMQLQDLEAERVELQTQQDIIQLLNLSDEEVRTGVLRPQGAGKGRPITQALQRLRKNLRPEVRFISEQLDSVFDSFAAQTGEMQVLQVRDTASPKITIEIGEIPLASCQNYRNGIMNDSLIGYTDPNSKILLLSNERGNPVARSVLRILSDESGNPVLHAETIYTTDVSDGVARAIYQHALDKAKAMGIPLYISSVSQNDEGHMVGARQVEGITTEPNEASLSSQGSRAPLVYVDSAGGWQKSGKYAISNVSMVSSST